MIKSETVANVRFDQYKMEDLVYDLLNPKKACMVVTPNVDHVIRVNRDPSFMDLYSKADISVNDSRIFKILTKIIGINIGDVIPGSDLTRNIIEKIKSSEKKITIIGSSNDTIDEVKRKYSLINISHYNPPMGFIHSPEETNKCLNFMLDNQADLIFIAVGSPRQEIIASKYLKEGGKGTVLCIGASLLFLSGEEKRAPLFIQRLSLEWLFRLLQSPKRLAKRYLVDGLAIFPLIIKEASKRYFT